MSLLTLTLGAKNREKKNKLRKKIENRKKMRKELSPLLAILTIVAFDIVKFFLSLNHSMLILYSQTLQYFQTILQYFFSDYLIDRLTQYSKFKYGQPVIFFFYVSYSSQITLYSSLYICLQSIFKLIIWKISYSGSLYITTDRDGVCISWESQTLQV